MKKGEHKAAQTARADRFSYFLIFRRSPTFLACAPLVGGTEVVTGGGPGELRCNPVKRSARHAAGAGAPPSPFCIATAAGVEAGVCTPAYRCPPLKTHLVQVSWCFTRPAQVFILRPHTSHALGFARATPRRRSVSATYCAMR